VTEVVYIINLISKIENDSTIIDKNSAVLEKLTPALADWYLGLILSQNYKLDRKYKASTIYVMNLKL